MLVLRLAKELALTSALCAISATIPLVTSKLVWHDVGTLSSMRTASNVAIVAGILVELPVDAIIKLPSASVVIVTLSPARRRRIKLEASSDEPDPGVLSRRCCLKASLISTSCLLY